MGKGPVPLPVLVGAVVVGWLQQVEGPLQVVPVVAALWPLDVLVGPGLECEHRLMPRPRVVRRGHVHRVVSRPDEGWSVRQNPVVGQGAS